MSTVPNLSDLPKSISSERFWAMVGAEESGTVEFKEQLPRAGKLQEPLVAFTNARGGTTVIGVSKNRPYRILGTSWSQEDEERVQEAARGTQPPLSVSTAAIQVEDRQVVLLQVEPVGHGWVHTSDGRLLVRAGPTNRALVGQELARFVQERGSVPVEDRPVLGVDYDDLRPDLVSEYLRQRLGAGRRDPRGALRDLRLIDPKGHLRLAGVLLFGKQPQSDNRRFGVLFSRFAGSISGGAQLRDRAELHGPLPDLVHRADQLVYEEMRRDAVVRGLVREEVPEFPPVAVREALVNAVGHRDYSARGSAVEVRLYDDALEIESPGTLPGWVTVENLAEAQYSRNELVMDGLQRLGLVEEAGQGIDRMIAEMEDALLDPPEFVERSASFVVRLRGTSVFAVEDRLWVSEFSDLDLSANAKVAVVYARRHGSISNEDLRALRGVDRDTSRGVLQDLVARGLLEAVGRGRGARYVLGSIARRTAIETSLDEQMSTVMNHARRKGSIVNSDVRGLLDVSDQEARAILVELVARGLLGAEGERRGRRYFPRDRTNRMGPRRPNADQS
jgi:ATP-dependent DNA helicase RecG